MRRRSFHKSLGDSLPDFSGLNISYMWSLFKTNIATVDYCLGVVNDSGTNLRYIYWDDNGEVSLTSKISFDKVTPHATQDVQYYIDNLLDGGSNIWVLYGVDQVTGKELEPLASTSQHHRLWNSSTGLDTDNGKVALKPMGINSLRGTAVSILDNTEQFSIYAVGSNDNAADRGTIFCSSITSSAGTNVNLNVDRRAAKRLFVSDGDTADYTSQVNSGNQRRMGGVFDPGVNIKSYYNGTLQNTVSETGSHNNDNVVIGSRESGNNPLDGHFQMLVLMDTNHSDAVMSDLDDRADNYFNF